MILVGPVGSGKTSLINAMINYVLGVKWTNVFWFLLCDEQKTSETVVYQINHQEGFQVDFSLTIIDTPGFGDFQRDGQTTEQIKHLFKDLVNLHAVCLVLQSPSARLTPKLRFTLDSMLSFFGKDISENIMILVTFADDLQPPVLEAAVPWPRTEDGLPVHYKFNNSALFVLSQTSSDPTEESFWRMGNKNMEAFFSKLEKTQPNDLSLTREVEQRRLRLKDLLLSLRWGNENQRVECSEALNRLKEVALKPKPLFTPEHIKMLIKEEESEKKPGWSERVRSLKIMKFEA
ncbi:uncharacterized protein [Eucyclogobius newberryi]|uniref:uncharacterized protein n=1 Tax=Eucyclogobius newberryi TaxID=166745 RepID=UPI003B5C557C